MNVFMIGWEFPPFISGGLGTACYGLTKALSQLGTQISFVLPKANPGYYTEHLKMLTERNPVHGDILKNVKFHTVTSSLKPYVESGKTERFSYARKSQPDCSASEHSVFEQGQANYGCELYKEVYRYADRVADIAAGEQFDIIHAHDWMTYPAAVAAAELTKKPLIVQVHSTEFDRCGENINQVVYDMERYGMHKAHRIVAVSNYTKNIITNRYGIDPAKVDVVYNGVECNNITYCPPTVDRNEKIVLFLARITMQKGPEYFVEAAKKVLTIVNNVTFVMAGHGDMFKRTIEHVAALGIGHKVLFTKFLGADDVNRIYQMAHLYVMPSVSEPFGIAPLEAMGRNVPAIISKQSGVAEILNHALKVDFWDINEMANKIVAVLKYPHLHKLLSQNGRTEAYKIQWKDSAVKVNKIYQQTVASA